MKRKYTRCVFDICNYCGHNGGAWADLWGDDLITFGGAWHGDWIDYEAPTSWMPGIRDPAYDTEARRDWTFQCGDRLLSHAGGCWFGVIGDVSWLLRRFDADLYPLPEDFRGLRILTTSEIEQLVEGK